MKHKVRARHLPGKLSYTGKNQTPTNVHLIQFGESFFSEKKTNNPADISSLINDHTVSWIKVTGMNDPELIIQLVSDFGLNTMDAKDVLTTQNIVTVEEYDENVFIVLPIIYYNQEKKEIIEHLALILGKNYVITFQESDYPLFMNIYVALKDNPSMKLNNKKSDFLLASFLNEIICNYSDSITILEDSLEELEDKLLDIDNQKDNLMVQIQERRREMIRIRKMLLPFKDQFAKLLRVDESLIKKQEIPYYKDTYDQLLYILQNIESCREILSSLVDLYLNNNDLKMNIVMKQLTVVATIFIPLTFIVGVWGMNFKFIPELEWRYGYLFAWVIMGICVLVVWLYLRKKKWF